MRQLWQRRGADSASVSRDGRGGGGATRAHAFAGQLADGDG